MAVTLNFIGLVFSCISIFASSLSSNQLNSFVIGVFLNIFFYYGFDIISQLINSGSVSLVIQKMGIINHYELLSKGLISSNDIVYFVSISILFIMLCQLNIEKK